VAVIHGAAAAAFAKAGFVRAHELLRGRDPHERRLAAHRANAQFLVGLGLDPDTVLGPPPVPTPIRLRRPVPVPFGSRGSAAYAGG
jgi:hypothetical protein